MASITVRVYKNGDLVTNCVAEKDLESHLAYNMEKNPECALFVNGSRYYDGSLTDGELRLYEEIINRRNYSGSKITKPYL